MANPNSTALSFGTTWIKEVDPSGKVVQTQYLPTTIPSVWGYTITSSIDAQSNQKFQFKYTFDNNATVRSPNHNLPNLLKISFNRRSFWTTHCSQGNQQ